MTRYQKLGVVSIRWMAVGLFTMTAIWIPLSFLGARAMSGMMMGPGTMGQGMLPGMMTGPGMTGAGFLWSPIAVALVVGVLLYALARPLGSAIGSGLED